MPIDPKSPPPLPHRRQSTKPDLSAQIGAESSEENEAHMWWFLSQKSATYVNGKREVVTLKERSGSGGPRKKKGGSLFSLEAIEESFDPTTTKEPNTNRSI